MTELTQFLQMAGLFLLGLIVRLTLALLVVVLLATPILIGIEAWKRLAAGKGWRRRPRP